MGHLFGQDGVRVPSVWEQHGGFYVDLVALAVRSGTLADLGGIELAASSADPAAAWSIGAAIAINGAMSTMRVPPWRQRPI